jgi:hypothetical protein
MELAGLLLLILLPPSDATGDLPVAIEGSLRQELGAVSLAIAPDTLVTPAMYQGKAAQMPARFVAHVYWKDQDRVRIEIVAGSQAPADRTSARELAFAQVDSKSERGRAIGLALAELLRESPVSAWIETPRGPPPANAGQDTHLALGGMLAFEHIRNGNWATGPEATYDFGLGRAFRLGLAGAALFSSSNQYAEFGLSLGLTWEFLRSENRRHALGVGMKLGLWREAATVQYSEHSSSDSCWSGALAASVHGRVTLWGSLRLVGEVDLRGASSGLSLTVGDDSVKTTTDYSRFRPLVALGLEYAL